jgi:hypothetical protein
MRAVFLTILVLTAGFVGLLAQAGPGTLNIYYIDTEGGQSTLFVSPTGESLVDSGNAGDRDLGRIVDTLVPPPSAPRGGGGGFGGATHSPRLLDHGVRSTGRHVYRNQHPQRLQ